MTPNDTKCFSLFFNYYVNISVDLVFSFLFSPWDYFSQFELMPEKIKSQQNEEMNENMKKSQQITFAWFDYAMFAL